MSRYYIIHQGERFYKQSVKEIAKLAQKVADEIGHAVTVYEDHTGTGFGGNVKGDVKPFKRNPAANLAQYRAIVKQGKDAALAGRSLASNPYSDPKKRASWFKGFKKVTYED